MNTKSKKTTSATCTHCNNHPLTITHILHECHTTETERQKYGINANINLTSQNDIQRVLLYLKRINYYTSNGAVVANDLAVDATIKLKKKKKR